MGHRMVGLVVVSLLVAILTVASGHETRANAATDWPAFTAVYRAEGLSRGHEGEPVTTIWRLTYRDLRHWRKEVIASDDPRAIGTVSEMADTAYTQDSAITRHAATSEYPDAPVVPERWLVPNRERFLVAQGYTRAIDAKRQQARYTKSARYPCSIASCAATPTFLATETIVYRLDLGLPVEVISEVEGMVRERITLVELTLP